MLRSLVLAVAGEPHVRALLTAGPGRSLARRFVAGERLEDAMRVVRRLRATGARVSIDFLGEAVGSATEARRAAAVYHQIIVSLRNNSLDASLSIKPSQFGVDLDFELCRGLVAELAHDAATLPATVRLDMESSAYTEITLRLWRSLRGEHPNVGIVLQSSLRRTAQDLEDTVAEGASIRLCKGAYAEPARVAYQAKADVDANYEQLMRVLLEAAGSMSPLTGGNEPRAAIATHDQRMIWAARRIARRLGLGPDRYEFQMLYGIRRDIQSRLLEQGEPLRIYVPWGPAWYPYLTRRLAERPANVMFVGRAILTELTAGRRKR